MIPFLLQEPAVSYYVGSRVGPLAIRVFNMCRHCVAKCKKAELVIFCQKS